MLINEEVHSTTLGCLTEEQKYELQNLIKMFIDNSISLDVYRCAACGDVRTIATFGDANYIQLPIDVRTHEI